MLVKFQAHAIIGSPENYAVTIASPTNHFVVLGTYIQFDNGTRMHSIRMRTIHCSGHPGGGVYPKGGVYPGGVHSPCEQNVRITDRCKNIIFPQLRLQTVIRLLGACTDSTPSEQN